jgi:hypothetical protein
VEGCFVVGVAFENAYARQGGELDGCGGCSSSREDFDVVFAFLSEVYGILTLLENERGNGGRTLDDRHTLSAGSTNS